MPTIKELIKKEYRRQSESIDLIPSENIASTNVREALSSHFVNKYAEGYPRKRYYPGNQIVDTLEERVRELALAAFQAPASMWRANVQPHSGSVANAAIYLGLLEFGDTIMGLSLTHGGHLTHGHRVTYSGRAYRAVHYQLGVDGLLDYDNLEKLARQHKPKMIISGASAYPRKINFRRIAEIAKSVGALHLADISHISGLIAAGVHPSPFPYADVVMTTMQKTLRGPRAGIIFSRIELADRIDRAVFPGLQGGPHIHTMAAVGVALEEVQKKTFVTYQKNVLKNADALAIALAGRGFALLSGGTDNHLLLTDVRVHGFSGKEAERMLEAANILANRNTVPEDPSPFNPSGLRMGTPSVTTRGMKVREMNMIAHWIADVLSGAREATQVRREVLALCKKFPIK